MTTWCIDLDGSATLRAEVSAPRFVPRYAEPTVPPPQHVQRLRDATAALMRHAADATPDAP